MTEREFREVIRKVSAEVATWPLWKQNILKVSCQPMMTTPRTPIHLPEAEPTKNPGSN